MTIITIIKEEAIVKFIGVIIIIGTHFIIQKITETTIQVQKKIELWK
jgi:hypothetical protein